jgi:hypothetical protein
VETVHVFAWIKAVQHLLLIDMIGDRHLNQNAVYRWVGVQFVNTFEQRLGRFLRINLVVIAVDSQVITRLLFHRDVRLACSILAHQDRRKSWRDALVS